jgi:hypothetical protein
VKTCASEPAPSVAISGRPSNPGIGLSSFQVRQPSEPSPASNGQVVYSDRPFLSFGPPKERWIAPTCASLRQDLPSLASQRSFSMSNAFWH